MKLVLAKLFLFFFQVGSCAGHHNVLITWPASVTPDVTLYNVYRATQSGGPYSLIGNTSGLSYVDSDVQDGAAYYYCISAVSEIGESACSQEAQAQIP